MRRILPLLFATSTLTGVSLGSASAQTSEDRPNIVIIVTDDQRADTLKARYMPNVAALMADTDRTTTFDQGFVPNALCCPSRVSILTGAHSHTNGVYGIDGRFGGFGSFDDDVSIATALERDYRTAFVGKYLNGYPTVGNYDYVPPGWDSWFAVPTGAYYNYSAAVDHERRSYGSSPRDYSGRVLTNRAIEEVESATAAGQPFLLYYAPTAPHAASPDSRLSGENAPSPDPRDVDRFVSEPAWRPGSYGNRDDVGDMPAYIQQIEWSDGQGMDLFRQRQLEAIYGADREIGRLVSRLPNDTLILFISDNGFSWGEHRWKGKIVPYEESISVPMFVRWPPGTDLSDVDAGRLALNIDFVPTILDIARYPAGTPTATSHYDGQDRPIPPDGISVYSDPPRTSFPLEHWEAGSRVPGYCGLRTLDGYMYVRYWDGDSPDNGFQELYNVAEDPLQRTNLVGDPAFTDIQATLKQETREQCDPVPPRYSWGQGR